MIDEKKFSDYFDVAYVIPNCNEHACCKITHNMLQSFSGSLLQVCLFSRIFLMMFACF